MQYVEGRCLAGLVTGTLLPPMDLKCDGAFVQIHEGELVRFTEGDELTERKMMEEFTKLGILYHITGRPVTLPLTLFLVPIHTVSHQPDVAAIERLATNPYGNND
jgi:endoribonuclease Dicer